MILYIVVYISTGTTTSSADIYICNICLISTNLRISVRMSFIRRIRIYIFDLLLSFFHSEVSHHNSKIGKSPSDGIQSFKTVDHTKF